MLDQILDKIFDQILGKILEKIFKQIDMLKYYSLQKFHVCRPGTYSEKNKIQEIM